ncbi:MAG: hypothetical protein WA896_00050 [Spirulinaceae cyanobacterium]
MFIVPEKINESALKRRGFKPFFVLITMQFGKRFNFWLLLLTLSIWLLIISSASANFGPPQGIILLGLPVITSLYSFGSSLVIVILLEAWWLSRREEINFRQGLKLAAIANVFSTIAGFFFTVSIIVLPLSVTLLPVDFTLITLLIYLLIFSFSIGLFFDLGKVSAHYLRKIRWQKFALPKQVWGIVWGIVWFLVGLMEFLLSIQITGSSEESVKFFGIAVFLLVGFLLSVICEGYIIADRLPNESRTIGKTVFIMNAISYILIVSPLTLGLFLISRGIGK